MAEKKEQLGCLAAVVAIPSSVLWLILLYRLLAAMNSATSDWCLFVAYCVCVAASICVGTAYRILAE